MVGISVKYQVTSCVFKKNICDFALKYVRFHNDDLSGFLFIYFDKQQCEDTLQVFHSILLRKSIETLKVFLKEMLKQLSHLKK